MKKITKVVAAILLIAVMSVTNVTAFAADEGISPRLSHMSDVSLSFSAVNNVGHINVGYDGYDSFVRADLNVKIEKRFLLAFWNDVCEWNASSTEMEEDFYHACTLDGSGMYRATFTLVITGNDGTTETVTDVIKSKY